MGAGNRMLQGRGGRNQFGITDDDMRELRESLQRPAPPTQRPTIYIAGPDVFEPNPLAVGERLKAIAGRHGFTPLFPMDNAVAPGDPNPSLTIFEGNAAMIQKADIVVANLNPFRGGIEPDSGTVWEVGYALGLGKRVVGYIASDQSMVARVYSVEGCSLPATGPYRDAAGRTVEDFGHPLNLMLIHSIEHLVIGSFEDALAYLVSSQSRGQVAARRR